MARHSSRVRSPDGRATEGFSPRGRPIKHAMFGQHYTSIERVTADNYRVVVMRPGKGSYQSGNAKTEAEARELRSRFLAE